MKIKPIQITVTFPLPDWFPPERLDYSVVRHYSKGHIWEGTYEGTDYYNSAGNAIMKLSGTDEFCSDPMGPWISFRISPRKNLTVEIEKISAKLDRFLRRYKESRQCQK
ncbi:MAG: hypothetical protein WC390_10395 [Sulfurimonas sp.]|jgi:hypothetical protein